LIDVRRLSAISISSLSHRRSLMPEFASTKRFPYCFTFF
jgi:hypothetical protein